MLLGNAAGDTQQPRERDPRVTIRAGSISGKRGKVGRVTAARVTRARRGNQSRLNAPATSAVGIGTALHRATFGHEPVTRAVAGGEQG
jgi:hypothetical protein